MTSKYVTQAAASTRTEAEYRIAVRADRCPACNGIGLVDLIAFGTHEIISQTCARCNGTGKRADKGETG